MKKILSIIILTGLIVNLAACGKKDVNEDSSNIPISMYMGNNGWNVTYDEDFFQMNELSQGQDIELIYTGECKGSAYVELMEIAGKDSDEYIQELQSEYEQTSEIYDVADENKSGYVFYVPGITPEAGEGNDRYTSVEVLNLKEGCLVVTASQMLDEEMKISDMIADIINSIEIN